MRRVDLPAASDGGRLQPRKVTYGHGIGSGPRLGWGQWPEGANQIDLGEAFDGEALHPRGLATEHDECGLRAGEGLGQEGDHSGVGQALGGRRGHPDLQHQSTGAVAHLAVYTVAPAAGRDADRDLQAISRWLR